MFVKIMGRENLPDGDPCKTFQLVQAGNTGQARMIRRPEEDGGPYVQIDDPSPGVEPYCIPVTGNVYVLNDDGRTIASFAADISTA